MSDCPDFYVPTGKISSSCICKNYTHSAGFADSTAGCDLLYGCIMYANSVFDVYVLLFFGGVAYFMNKIDLPPVPIVLGMVLGPIAESNLRNALVLSGGSWRIFLQRPICLMFIILTVVLIVVLKKGSKKEKAAAEKLQAMMDADAEKKN